MNAASCIVEGVWLLRISDSSQSYNLARDTKREIVYWVYHRKSDGVEVLQAMEFRPAVHGSCMIPMRLLTDELFFRVFFPALQIGN